MATVNGIKSKDNVREYGEVFTPDSIVNDMLDLVDNAMKDDNLTPEEYITKTYLEPSCGDGQFLIRILDRKLVSIVNGIAKENWELATLRALSTIYGVDIQQINIDQSKRRMMELLKNGTVNTFDLPNKEIKNFTKIELNWTHELERVIQYILDKNIVCGDSLCKDGQNEVIITEFIWRGTEVAQKAYSLNNLDIEIDSRYKDYIDYRQLGLNDETDDDEFDIDSF